MKTAKCGNATCVVLNLSLRTSEAVETCTLSDIGCTKMKNKQMEEWLDVLNYWFEHIEDYGVRYPEMEPMVRKFEAIIDSLYEQINKD